MKHFTFEPIRGAVDPYYDAATVQAPDAYAAWDKLVFEAHRDEGVTLNRDDYAITEVYVDHSDIDSLCDGFKEFIKTRIDDFQHIENISYKEWMLNCMFEYLKTRNENGGPNG